MAYNSELLDIVDYRITQSAERVTAIGTVSSRSTSFYDNQVMVLFDGSNLAVPVKMFANVEAWPGDRVGLVKFGSEWVVVGGYTRRWPDSASYNAQGQVGTTTSVGYADLPGVPGMSLTKRWDETRMALGLIFSLYATASGTLGAAGVRVDGPTGTTYMTLVPRFEIDVANSHGIVGGYTEAAGFGVGDYTVTPQWAWVSGPGTLTHNTGDTVSAWCAEVTP